MHWIDSYDLYLFDFDGLLVNTEEMHFAAYKKMLAKRGYYLDWSFERYCQFAHYQAAGLKEELRLLFPALFSTEEEWLELYSEKQENLLRLFEEGAANLMPAVDQLIDRLTAQNKKLAVVTHSPRALIDAVRKRHPSLQAIPNWITRENYSKPKPDPECYLEALRRLLGPGEKAIGFEDTPRGVRALLGTKADICWITPYPYPEISEFLARGVRLFPTISALLEGERTS